MVKQFCYSIGLFLFFVFQINYSRAQQFQFIDEIKGQKSVIVEDMEVFDSSVFLVGRFDGVVAFDTLTISKTSGNAYSPGIFIAKYDLLGKVEWVRQFTSNHDMGNAEIEVNDSGIFIKGEVFDSLFFENQFISIGTRGVKGFSKIVKTSLSKTIAFIAIHAAMHNSYGSPHVAGSILGTGQEITDGVTKGGKSLYDYAKDGDSKPLKIAAEETYGTADPEDNYEENKSNED